VWSLEELEILGAVVRLDPVDVMHVLGGRERSAVDTNEHVTLMRGPATTPVRMAAAKKMTAM
jgi:hypothetical protein